MSKMVKVRKYDTPNKNLFLEVYLRSEDAFYNSNTAKRPVPRRPAAAVMRALPPC
jgi:hypothetical protein